MNEMILGTIGLILNFIGSFGLVLDSFFNLGKPKALYLPIHEKGKIKNVIRMERQNNGIFKQVKRTKEEIKFIIFLSLLSLGFLLQLLDFLLNACYESVQKHFSSFSLWRLT